MAEDGRSAFARGGGGLSVVWSAAWISSVHSSLETLEPVGQGQPGRHTHDRPVRRSCELLGKGCSPIMLLQWVRFPPGNWVAPAGSYRSEGGGNEATGAFEKDVSPGDAASRQAVT
jgi:hypothetical protein